MYKTICKQILHNVRHILVSCTPNTRKVNAINTSVALTIKTIINNNKQHLKKCQQLVIYHKRFVLNSACWIGIYEMWSIWGSVLLKTKLNMVFRSIQTTFKWGIMYNYIVNKMNYICKGN